MAMKNDLLKIKTRRGENALPAWLGIDAIEWYYRWRLPIALRRSSALRCTAAPAWRLLESRAVRVTSPDETRLSGEFHNERQRDLLLPRNPRSTSERGKEKKIRRKMFVRIIFSFATLYPHIFNTSSLFFWKLLRYKINFSREMEDCDVEDKKFPVAFTRE